MTNERPTVLGFSVIDRLIIYLGVPALFVLVGSAPPFVARWMLSWGTALPLRSAFRVVGAVDTWWEVAINVANWLVIGFLVAFAVQYESAVVTLTAGQVCFRLGDKATTVARSDVAAAFIDRKRLVVLDHETHQVFRERTQASHQVLAAAFRAHGYPWQDSDPYDALFRPWKPGTADLPLEVDSVLAARESALKRKAAKEAEELRNVAQNWATWCATRAPARTGGRLCAPDRGDMSPGHASCGYPAPPTNPGPQGRDTRGDTGHQIASE